MMKNDKSKKLFPPFLAVMAFNIIVLPSVSVAQDGGLFTIVPMTKAIGASGTIGEAGKQEGSPLFRNMSSDNLNTDQIKKGDYLSEIVSRYLLNVGYKTVWKANDLKSDIDLTVYEKDVSSVNAILAQFVEPLGFKYTIYENELNKVIVVTQ